MIPNEDSEYLLCGYLKAKFTLEPELPLEHCESYQWTSTFGRPRVTQNFVYLVLGHKDLPDNKTAREYILQIKKLGGKITRIDFYRDYINPFAFRAFYALHNTGKPPIPTVIESPSGSTVYVGKRSSPRMLRVYDKTGEIKKRTKQDIGFDITRIEMEVKRRMVHRYVELFMSQKTDIILNDIQELYGLRNFIKRSKVYQAPLDTKAKSSAMAFVWRYRTIIRKAYMSDPIEFMDTIGVENED